MFISDLRVSDLAVSSIVFVVVTFVCVQETNMVAGETDVDMATHVDIVRDCMCTWTWTWIYVFALRSVVW